MSVAGALAVMGLGRLVDLPTWLILTTAALMLLLAFVWAPWKRTRNGRAALIGCGILYAVVAIYGWSSNRLTVISIREDWYPRLYPSDPSIMFVYRTLRMQLNKSGDWGTRARVQLTDGSTDELKRLAPTNLRISKAGHLEIVADVLVHRLSVTDGPIFLVREDFDDFAPGPAIRIQDQIGRFSIPAILTLDILIDGALLKRFKFEAKPEGQKISLVEQGKK